jgi:peroxiredoxin/predicted 2-oxoglutarate/Fe(II)-dependent dioxygenase YbiX
MPPQLWSPGDTTPDFSAPAAGNPRFAFHTTAGRYVVLSFLGDSRSASVQEIVSHIESKHSWFDDERICFFGVSTDHDDMRQQRLRERIPGIRYFWDADRSVSKLYGAVRSLDPDSPYSRFTLVLDPMLRVLANIPADSAERHNQALDITLSHLPLVQEHAGVALSAPVLILPRVFESELCRELVRLYEQYGGEDSGFMREVDGKTVAVMERKFKRRQDFDFMDRPELAELRRILQVRLRARLVPQIKRAFQFDVTRMERYIVARYASSERGFFRPHKDNTTLGTAHRRFACTINLNAEEYTGGDLRFPEFGNRTYRAPTGGAVVFSCSLLHEALPVTQGIRYAFLPFFYDDAAARIRQSNAHSLTGQSFDHAKGEDEYKELRSNASEFGQ